MAQLILQSKGTTGGDTFIFNEGPNENRGTSTQIEAGWVNALIAKAMVRFDLSALPAGALISSAILTLQCVGEDTSQDRVINVHRGLIQWYEGNVSSGSPTLAGSTWNKRNHVSSVNWATNVPGGAAGQDYTTVAEGGGVVITGTGSFSWTVTSIVQLWANGTANHGFWLLNGGVDTDARKAFASFESGTTAWRPKLTITYTSSQVVAPAARTAVGSRNGPTAVIKGSAVLGPAARSSVGEAFGPSMVNIGYTLAPAPAEAIAETVSDLSEVGGETFLGGNASAVGATSGPSEVTYNALIITSPITAVGASSGPSATVKGSIVLIPVPASAVGAQGGFASLVDLALRPAAASAIGRTVGKVVALRIYPVYCDPRPYLYLSDGTVKDNGQLHLLSLIDAKNGFILNNWTPNVAQYKGGGTFSDSPQAHGRRLARRVFDNAIEVLDLKVRGHDQDRVIQFLSELFRWQEMAADYWISDWGDRPVYLAAKAASEMNLRYAPIIAMSVPELANPYAQPFFSQNNKPSLENISLRIERGPWADSPPGEGTCVPISSKRSWTVSGWTEGETAGGGDATITGDIISLVQAGNGDILAGTEDQAQIYRSTDSGATWILLAKLGSGSDRVNAMVKDYQGYLYAAVTGTPTAQGVWKSTNHGVSWTRIKTHSGGVGFNDIAYVQSNNTLVAVSNATAGSTSPIAVSWDAGVTWAHPFVPHYYYNVMSVASFETPGLITLTPETLNGPEAFFGMDSYYTIAGRASRNAGNTAFAKETASGQMGNGGLDMAAYGYRNPNGTWGRRALWAVKSAADVTDTEIWQWPNPASGADTFGKIATIDSKLFNVLYVDPSPDANNAQRTIWAGANGEIYVSYNSGYSWSLATSAPANQIRALLRTSSGTLLAGGDNGEVFIFSGDTSTPGGGIGGGSVGSGSVVINTYPLGMEETCEDSVFVANKSSFTNITHVLHYNGSTYSELQFVTEPPYELLGTNPTVNKAAYFGSQTTDPSVPGGPFSGLVFDITQIAEDVTVTWEYWNGSTWAALTVQDNSSGFRVLGVNSVHWILPVAWSTNTVNGITGYWIRARVSAVGSSPVYPIHDNRFIYMPNLPYVEIAEDVIDGDLPAKAQIRWHNRSDDPGSSVDLEVDRLVCGLRSVHRGEFFNAYLNISDEQIPYGFTLSKDADGSFGASRRAPTNRALTVTHASSGRLNVWNDLFTFSISNTVARDYYGTYRAFIRCYKYGSGTNVWQLRVRTSFGTGGSKSDTKSAFPTTSAEWEILDLGQLSIPTTQVSTLHNNLGDALKIIVQGYATATGSGIVLYDLILIPVDEWAVDARAPELSTENTAKVIGGAFLDIDSISNPKVSLVASNRNSADLIVARYQAITNGPAILQNGAHQRLWTLGMSYENFWLAAPEVVGTMQVFKQQQYLGFRGAR